MSKRLLTLALVLGLLCAACGGGGDKDAAREGQHSLFFLSRTAGEVEREWTVLPEGRSQVESLLSLLLKGPQNLELATPIPAGTRLRSWTLSDGLVTVDLSELYGGLSEISLTQADGCIVLTLCQLEEVEQVYITIEGRPRPFRDKVYSAADFLLQSGAPPAGEQELELWFPDGGEGLVRESRTVRLGAGDRPEVAALLALLEGPGNDGAQPIAPEGTSLLGLERRGDVFRVDLSAQWLEGEEDPCRIWSLVRTLTALEPQMSVTFRVEGQPLTAFAGLDLTGGSSQALGYEP